MLELKFQLTGKDFDFSSSYAVGSSYTLEEAKGIGCDVVKVATKTGKTLKTSEAYHSYEIEYLLTVEDVQEEIPEIQSEKEILPLPTVTINTVWHDYYSGGRDSKSFDDRVVYGIYTIQRQPVLINLTGKKFKIPVPEEPVPVQELDQPNYIWLGPEILITNKVKEMKDTVIHKGNWYFSKEGAVMYPKVKPRYGYVKLASWESTIVQFGGVFFYYDRYGRRYRYWKHLLWSDSMEEFKVRLVKDIDEVKIKDLPENVNIVLPTDGGGPLLFTENKERVIRVRKESYSVLTYGDLAVIGNPSCKQFIVQGGRIIKNSKWYLWVAVVKGTKLGPEKEFQYTYDWTNIPIVNTELQFQAIGLGLNSEGMSTAILYQTKIGSLIATGKTPVVWQVNDILVNAKSGNIL